VSERLGLPAEAGEDEVRTSALAAVVAWRDRAEDPLARRATVDACEVLARSAEGFLARLDLPVSDEPDGDPARADRESSVVVGAQPGA
jgi:hypothetical protein